MMANLLHRFPRIGRRWWPAAALAVALLTGCGRQPAAEPPEPVALVLTVPVRVGALTETLTAYGTVIPAPGARSSLAVPFASRVRRVLINAGQTVAPGDTMLLLDLASEARVLAQEARNADKAAAERLAAGQKRLELGLATRDEVADRRREREDAEAGLQAVDAWNSQLVVTAPYAGIIDVVDARAGALVPAGDPLLSLARSDGAVIRMGVEPEDAGLVAPGQRVTVVPIGRTAGPAPLEATVRSVARQVSADTRLVPVLAVPGDSTESLLLGQFVRGEITVRQARGLIVPRRALLPVQDRFTLFTVHNGRAVRHIVAIGVETDSLVAVKDTSLAASDSVVILGNYELADGMRVRTTSTQTDSTAAAGGNP